MLRHTRQHCDYQNGFAELQTTLKIPVRKPNFALVSRERWHLPRFSIRRYNADPVRLMSAWPISENSPPSTSLF
jgi:hypothetical protein